MSDGERQVKGRAYRQVGRGDGTTPNDVLKELFSLPDFISFSLREREEIGSVVVIRSFWRGALILRENGPADSLFILIRGLLRVRRVNPQGKELTLKTLGPSSVVGELSVITGCSRTADVVAEEPSVLAEIPQSSFEMLLNTSPSFSRVILQGLARNLQSSTERLSAVTFLDIQDRLLLVLKTLATTVDLNNQTSLLIRELPSHHHLATLVGCTRETISRGLKKLHDDDLIEIDGDQVWIVR